MVERVPAVICDVDSLTKGTYVEMPGWDPNYVIIDERVQASRVNVIGIITQAQAEGNVAQYVLDDSSATIQVRSYESEQLEAKPGELVLVIGRPRVYQNEVYLAAEIIRPVKPAWAQHRKKQLAQLAAERAALPKFEPPEPSDEPEAALIPSTPPKPTAEPKKDASDTERIYAMIEKLDSGDGADISDVLAEADKQGIDDAEKAISHMLEMGDIFEIRAGKLKVL